MSAGKPRIAVVTSYFPTREEPYRGQSAYQTLRRLTDRAEMRAFVPLIIYPKWYSRAPKEFRGRLKMDLDYRPPDIDTRYFEYTTLPGAGRPFNGLLAYRKVRQAVTEFRPDLILNYWLYPDGWAAVRLGRQLRKPVIVCSLGSDLRRIEDAYTRSLTRSTVQRADYVLTVSGELAKQAIALGARPERTRAILNGYDEKVFHPGDRAAERARLGLAPDGEYVLYVGSLIPSKGLRELSAAFTVLAARRPRLHLVCVGEGPLRQELAGERVIRPGKLNGSEVRSWMVASNVFCLPSYSEGCPNVVVEALACDRPVVASDVGGIPELVNERNGILAPPRDATALGAAIGQALNRSWPPGEVAATFQRDWSRVADETWEVCSDTLA